MVFLGCGISDDSMVPMLRPGMLRLSSGGWDKRGCFPLFAWRKLSGTMGSPPGGRVWDRYPLDRYRVPKSLIQCLHIYTLAGSPQSNTKSTSRHAYDIGGPTMTYQL